MDFRPSYPHHPVCALIRLLRFAYHFISNMRKIPGLMIEHFVPLSPERHLWCVLLSKQTPRLKGIKGDKFLNKLWCCGGGTFYRPLQDNHCFLSAELITYISHRKEISKAHVSSVNPSPELIVRV